MMMLAQPHDTPFSRDGWLFQPKLDGYRSHLKWDGNKLDVTSRRGNSLPFKLPTPAKGSTPFTVDCEIVAMPGTRLEEHSFDQLQAGHKATPVVFDVLAWDGEDLTGLPLTERVALFGQVPYPTVPTIVSDGMLAWERWSKYEGIVAKDPSSTYRNGRSASWLKIVRHETTRLLVAGWMDGENSRSSTFGSLVLATPTPTGVRYVGRVGSGFTQQVLNGLKEAFPSLEGEPLWVDDRNIHWLQPKLTVVVKHNGWTSTGLLRAPSFKGFTLEPADAV